MAHSPTSSPAPQHITAPFVILSNTPPNEPPPPYPSRERRQRAGRSGRRRRTLPSGAAPDPSEHLQVPSMSTEGYSDNEAFPSSEGNENSALEATEQTPLLSPRLPPGGIGRRQRTLSISSTVHSINSVAPSLAHTLISAFHPDRDCDLDPEEAEAARSDSDSDDVPDSPAPRTALSAEQQRLFANELGASPRLGGGVVVRRPGRWRKYFRPMAKKPYYAALFHLLVLNFPYALVAWVYLFVLTLTGTTTLMALPLGAVLCFLDLIGARILARGELYLQSTFHYPLFFPIPNPPLPIFTRARPPTPAEIEDGAAIRPLKEKSFYKNAYAMFTDPTSYMPLFYFLVLKPPLTLLMSLFLVCIVPVSFILVLPAPAMLRLVRRLGVWQANVAVEGLCYPTIR